MLKNNGNIAIVHRTERLIDIIECMRKNNIEPKKIQFVYPKKNKESNILLIEGVKNGNPGIKILDSLYIHNENGTYTEQVMKYFEN
jgi:tRNA1(Val) A37 N6-methylase TrmN6